MPYSNKVQTPKRRRRGDLASLCSNSIDERRDAVSTINCYTNDWRALRTRTEDYHDCKVVQGQSFGNLSSEVDARTLHATPDRANLEFKKHVGWPSGIYIQCTGVQILSSMQMFTWKCT